MASTCDGIRAANWVIRRRRPKSDNYLKRCNLLAMALLVVVVVVVADVKYPCNDRAYFQAPIISNRLRHPRVSNVRKSITYLPNGPRGPQIAKTDAKTARNIGRPVGNRRGQTTKIESARKRDARLSRELDSFLPRLLRAYSVTY